jgi:hypothetical protein
MILRHAVLKKVASMTVNGPNRCQVPLGLQISRL